MSLSRRRWMLRCSAPLVVALMAAGCASGVGGGAAGAHAPGGSSQAALLQRTAAYWAAMQKNDKVAAWSYEQVSKDPKWTLETYLQRGGTVLDAVEVRDVASRDGDEAVVNVRIRFSVPLLRLKGQDVVEKDHWRLIDGEWLHVLKQSVMFSS
jgi:hypothetical protein